MRIDPTQPLNPQAVPGGKPGAQKPAQAQAGPEADAVVDGVEIRTRHAALLRQAAATDEIDLVSGSSR